ncbi:MFS transporter [Halomicrobium urmianum]|uniref:MFS transporter n=1 Tax=Halomicrobium urmianum TaxID=1586233 RepID=UPI001CD9A174|nr:MFS transporter [Halomicrobium urmianum]
MPGTRASLAAVREAPRSTVVVVGAISGSQFVNHAYLTLFPPILAVLEGDFGVGLGLLGVALGVQGATNTLFQLPFGHLADRYDRTLALGLSSLLGAVGVLATAVAPDYAWFLVGQAVVGIGVAGHHPAHYPLISDATPEDLLGRAFSVYGFGGSLGFAAPPVILGSLVATGRSWRLGVGAIGVVGLLYAAGITLLFARGVTDDVTAPNVDPAANGGGEAPWIERARSYVRDLLASPGILALALLALVGSTANWGFTSYVVVFLTDGYGLSLSLANYALTGAFVAGALAVFLGGHFTDRRAPGPVILWSFGLLTVLFALLATGLLPPLAAAGLVLAIGGTRAVAGPARSKLTDALSESGATGTNFAVITVGTMLGNAVAPPVFGTVIERFGPSVAFAGIAGVSVLAVAVTVWLVRRFDEA